MADTPSTGGLLAPRTAATYPDFVHPNELANGYANMAAQIQDAMSMPSRYPSSPFWGNGAGRFAYGTAPYGTPAYGNPAGRNAPWYVTGANGQGGQYPNPGTLLGQGQSPQSGLIPKTGTGLLGQQPQQLPSVPNPMPPLNASQAPNPTNTQGDAVSRTVAAYQGMAPQAQYSFLNNLLNGGSMQGGQWTPYAQANGYADIQALSNSGAISPLALNQFFGGYGQNANDYNTFAAQGRTLPTLGSR